MARSGTSVRYARVAAKIVRRGYTFSEYIAWTVSDLLEQSGNELEIDHILCEDDVKRAERVTRLANEIDSILESYISRRLRRSLLPSPTVTGSYVPGFAEATHDTASKAGTEPNPSLLERFRFTPDIEDVFGKLSPIAFEALCGAMLDVVGCENITITQSSKDDGVDAIAELRMAIALEQNSPLHRLAGSLSFLVYAQAKRYAISNPVRREEILELEGSWNAMRSAYVNRELSARQLASLERAGYRAADPVMLILMTSGRFTSGALAKARALGVILLDGEQMAQLLIEADWLSVDISGSVDLAVVVLKRLET